MTATSTSSHRRRSCLLAVVLFAIPLGCSGGQRTIEGSARLPGCSDAPATDLSGTWFDQGTVTITSDGCQDQGAANGESFGSCPLNWEFSQSGNEVTIVVDEEYEIRGRICGDTLHLEGGWWLPVENDQGQCGYDDDDGDEVGIESEGSSLQLDTDEAGAEVLVGTLVVRGQCAARYETQLQRIR